MILLFDSNVFKVLTVFSIAPGRKFQRKELKEKTKLSNVNLDKAISILFNQGILKRKKRLLFLDVSNSKTKQVISLVSDSYKSLKEIPLNVYFSVYELVRYLSCFKDINVYLFGSYSKLIFDDSSDIDIAIVSGSLEKEDKRGISRTKKKIKKKYGKKIEIHYFDSDFYKNKSDPLIKDILKNGEELI